MQILSYGYFLKQWMDGRRSFENCRITRPAEDPPRPVFVREFGSTPLVPAHQTFQNLQLLGVKLVGDWSRMIFERCHWRDVDVSEARWTNSHFEDCIMERVRWGSNDPSSFFHPANRNQLSEDQQQYRRWFGRLKQSLKHGWESMRLYFVEDVPILGTNPSFLRHLLSQHLQGLAAPLGRSILSTRIQTLVASSSSKAASPIAIPVPTAHPSPLDTALAQILANIRQSTSKHALGPKKMPLVIDQQVLDVLTKMNRKARPVPSSSPEGEVTSTQSRQKILEHQR